MAGTFFEDEGATPKAAGQELEEAFLPLLEEYSVSAGDAKALCEKVIEAVFPASNSTPSCSFGASFDFVKGVCVCFLCFQFRSPSKEVGDVFTCIWDVFCMGFAWKWVKPLDNP